MKPIACLCLVACLALPAAGKQPNIIVVIGDDMGHGDLGCHGNPKIRTPHLDRLAGQSVKLDSFCVSPVCSPTRASLMTGRYNYRTGVVDTFIGRSMMRSSEVTLAEMLSTAGYRTGIFGKWHLGDNYPMRPQDQGFSECLVHRGGGIGQPSDPPGGESYFDPLLSHNGKLVKTKGYCSDVYTDAALRFMDEVSDKPFFCYLAFNCPHDPLQVADELVEPYRKMNLAHDQFPKVGHPLPGKADQEKIARVYAMVGNIDDNVGRLLKRVDDNTIVVFLTDNGPASPRYNSGMRMRKGSVYDGGIRVPCYVRWPAKWKAGRVVKEHAAHIDLAPTLLAAAGVKPPGQVRFDGKDLGPLLAGDKVDWPDRTLFFQWHRGDVPELNRACAARSARWKLVQPLGVQAGSSIKDASFQLFDMQADPLEQNDVAAKHPDVVARMRKDYEAWFKDVTAAGFDPLRIQVGAPQQKLVALTRQDWRGPRAVWGPKGLGHWEVDVARTGRYRVQVRFEPLKQDTTLTLKLGAEMSLPLKKGAKEWAATGLRLQAGPTQVSAWLGKAPDDVGVRSIEVEWLD